MAVPPAAMTIRIKILAAMRVAGLTVLVLTPVIIAGLRGPGPVSPGCCGRGGDGDGGPKRCSPSRGQSNPFGSARTQERALGDTAPHHCIDGSQLRVRQDKSTAVFAMPM